MSKLTKFSRAILAIAIMLCVALPTLAHDFEVGGIYYNYLDKTAKTVEVTCKGNYHNSYSNEYTDSVTIPSSVTYSGTTYSVTSIGDEAFYYCNGLTSVTIPNSVTSIGDEAFYGCIGLTSIVIPNSVTSIGFYAFSYCRGLTSVTIPNSVTSIGSYAFYYCNGLTSVTIPNSVTSIADHAFSYCSGLTSVTIPNSVTSIGSGAFSNCTGLTSVTIGNSVTSIGSYAFSYCRGLTSVTIPNSVASIGFEAFYGCTGLTEVNISDLLAWCKIDFGNNRANPTCYTNKLKLNGSEIKDLVIPNDVTEIKYCAFYGCKGLTSITIPNSVTSIGDKAFYGCRGLTEVNISDLSAWCKIDFSNNSANPLCYANKLKLNGAEIKDLVIPNVITKIKDYAFYGCRGLTSVTIPNSVTSIGFEAFYYCKGLTSITIPNSVTSIGDEAFDGCWDLDTIISLNPTPPVCSSSSSFDDYYGTLYVPKDSYVKYFVDDVWGQFTNIKKIEILVSSITLNNSSIELDKGNAATLSATIAPSNATIKNIVWTSSNPQIATVDQSGKVTALTPGIATITAMANDGSNVSASCKVVVKGAEAETKITLSQTEANLPVNDIITLSYEVIPLTTPVEWSTSNENVAYIKKNADNSVMVVGMADGVAIITAKALDGSGVSASCVVTVGVGGVEGVEMDNNAVEVARYDIHGRLLSEPTKGLNIIKMSNGTTRKEIVK